MLRVDPNDSERVATSWGQRGWGDEQLISMVVTCTDGGQTFSDRSV